MKALVLILATVAAAYATFAIVHQDDDLRLSRLESNRPGTIAKAYDRMLEMQERERDWTPVLDAATPGQRILFTIEYTNDEIENGGLHQVLGNLPPSFVDEAERAARTIGAREYADLLRDAQRLVPALPEDTDRRWKLLDHIKPSADSPEFAALDRRWHEGMFQAELRRYIADHPSDFFKDT